MFGSTTRRKLGTTTVLILLVTALLLSMPLGATPSYSASSTKPLHFFLHYTSNPPLVGGTASNYIMDTERLLQGIRFSDLKRIGQPKISLDWYLYPNFAGAVTFDGLWQVIIFANSTALHPATWGLQFWEKTPQGSIVWDSGQLTPDVKGGPSGKTGFVDVPVFGYALTAELLHTFAPGNTLELEITINTGSTVPLRVWYDIPQYPSQAIFPSTDFARPISLATFDANNTARDVFFTSWGTAQRQVVVRANITDPFGGYDVFRVDVTIRDSANRSIVTNELIVRLLGNRFSFNGLYEFVWLYPQDAFPGKYRIEIRVIDNNGAANFELSGNYEPYVEFLSKIFSIGIEFPVSFRVEDSRGQPLPKAKLTFLYAGLPVEGGMTDSLGMLSLTLFAGSFGVQVSWQSIVVANQNVSVTNATNFTIRAAVYYPEFKFVSNAGKPINRAMVFLTSPNGSNTRLPFLSNAEGVISIAQLPVGGYGLLTFWEGELVADARLNVTGDGPYTIRTKIYTLTVSLKDNSGAPLNQIQIVVSSGEGVFDFGITGTSGQANFSLPVGTYKVSTYYSGSYWLNYILNASQVDVPLEADRAISISLSNVPPPIYLTIGFWLIAGPAIILAGFIAMRILRKR